MTSLADLEFSVLQSGKCLIQDDIHTPRNNGTIDTHFFEEEAPVTWYSHSDSVLEQTRVKDNEIKYTFKGKAAFLSKMQLHQHLPPVRVRTSYKEKYEIAYSAYPGIAIIEEIRLSIDDCSPMLIPGFYLNVTSQYYRKDNSDSEIRHERARLGHVPELLNWDVDLPAYDLRVNLPLLFCGQDSDALPINLSGKTNTATSVVQTITFRNKLCQILRMRRKDEEGQWEEMTGKDIKHHLHVLDAPESIETAEVRAWHSMNTGEEMDALRCAKSGKYERFYTDILHTTEPCLTSPVIHILDECTMPVRSLFWALENTLATAHNNWNVFTLDADCIEDGGWPIATSTLAYPTKTYRFKDMPNHYFLDNHRFPSNPMDPGLLAYNIGIKPNHRVDVGVALAALKARLQVELSAKVGAPQHFQLHVFAHVTRKMVLKKNPSGVYIAEISRES